ncbi:hypothetical protein N2152v2_004689 [Parachlorella kessleri]
MSIFATGNVLNFASFGFAAQSLLAALGVVQFLSNLVFARFMNHEHITKRVMCATGLVVIGCILLVSFGNHDSPIITAHDLLKLYSNGLKTQRDIRGPWARWLPICYALFSGLLGTQSVLYGKTLSMLLRTTVNGDSQLGFWYTWLSLLLFIFFAAFWLTRYSKALRLFPVSIIMPILQIVWVLFSIVCGSLYYQEYKTLTPLSGGMFAAGVVIMLAGIGFLASATQHVLQPEPEPLEDEELGDEEASGSLDTTPTAGGKLLAEGPPLRGSLRQKYTTHARDSPGALSTVDEDTAAAPSGAVPAQLQLDGGHARQPSDDAGLRLFAGESSSAAVWDAAPDMEAAVGQLNAEHQVQQQQQQPGPQQPAKSKRLELKVVVPVDAGEDVNPSATLEGKHSVLEDMDANFKQLALGFAGIDHWNPLSPAFTSFSMPLVPAVGAPPPRATAAGGPLSARGPRPQLSPRRRSKEGVQGAPGPPRSKHRLTRSRSAGELSEMMIKAAAMSTEEEVAAGVAARTGRSSTAAGLPQLLPVPRQPVRSPPGRASTEAPGALAANPAAALAGSSPRTPQVLVAGLGPDTGASTAPRLGLLGSGGTRRSWSLANERGTPAGTLGLETPNSRGSPGEGPTSTGSTKPPRINPLSPRAFLEDVDERVDMAQLLEKATKHD